MSLYSSGTVNLVSTSNQVTGNGTFFLKNVSKGSFFRAQADQDFYIVQSVVSDTLLTLTTAYRGETLNLYPYSITTDKTPNLGLPLMSRFDPDLADTINSALKKLDSATGDSLDYNSLYSYIPATYSGESAFFVKSNFAFDELAVGRIIKMVSLSGEEYFDSIRDNAIFEARISCTPVSKVVTFADSQMSGEYCIGKRDMLFNITRNNAVQIASVDTVAKTVTYSGEMIGSAGAWGTNDTLRVYATTRVMGTLTSLDVSRTSLLISKISGEAWTPSNFSSGSSLYSYNLNPSVNEATVLSCSVASPSGEIVQLSAAAPASWSAGNFIYSVRQKIETSTGNVPPNLSYLKYGARSTVAENSIKSSHVDFGYDYDQIHAGLLPVDIVGCSGEFVSEVLQEIKNDLELHKISGEVHHAGSIRFTDQTVYGMSLLSTDVNGAINELKDLFNLGIMIVGSVDDASDSTHVTDDSFNDYVPSFFSGEWYMRFETGPLKGELRKVASYASGEFVTSTPFSVTPLAGDSFRLIHK